MTKVRNELDFYIYCPYCAKKLRPKTTDKTEVKVCTCGFIFWNNPKPAASIIIHRTDAVLLLKRAKDPMKGYWVLPGGFINYQETVQEAITREAKEETNLKITIEKVVGVYRIDADPRGIHLDIIFAGKSNGKIILSSEHTHWEYFSKNTLPSQIAYEHRNAILDFFQLNS